MHTSGHSIRVHQAWKLGTLTLLIISLSIAMAIRPAILSVIIGRGTVLIEPLALSVIEGEILYVVVLLVAIVYVHLHLPVVVASGPCRFAVWIAVAIHGCVVLCCVVL